MKQEDFEYLKQFEDRFITALKANYARGIQSKDVEKIRSIYSEIIGQPYKMNTSCSSCILKLLQKISPYYYEFKNGQSSKKNSGETKKEEGNSGTDRYGTEEKGNPEETGKRKRKKGNRGGH